MEGGREGVRNQGVGHERSRLTCYSRCSNINTGFLGADAAALGQTQTVAAAGISGLWTGSLLLPKARLHLRV